MERSAVADAAGGLHGFPAVLTSFVGRAAVVDEIAGQLGQYRLVTLTGPGGAGKTRLAGEVARQVAGRFADGVWLAELAAVRDPAQITRSRRHWPWRSLASSPVSPVTATARCRWPGGRSRSRPAGTARRPGRAATS